MKSLNQIQEELLAASGTLGFNPVEIEQGSYEWQCMKLGVLSASNTEKILAKKGTATRSTYMAELVAQVCTKEFPEINAKAMQWGKDNEEAARSAYEFASGETVQTIGFIYKDSTLRVGISPDGIIEKTGRGLELKCPFTTKVFIEFVTDGKIKPEYEKQCQFSMWVADAETWDFANYDPRMKKKMLHHVTIVRDQELMKRFEQEVPEFIHDMDLMLKKVGFSFGDQWKN